MLKNKHLLDPSDFTIEEFDEIFKLAHQIMANPKEYQNICNGKILATLFYEPSTRTRLSFESAMLRLGGQVIGFSEPNSSSVSKGESLRDTIKTVNCYADLIAMRHPLEGAAKVASMYSDIPVINAGDGGHQHPTQTLTDLLTIKEYKGNLEGNTIALCGDLKFILISPIELRIPNYIREQILEKNNIEYKEITSLEEGIKEADILYMTRIQRERFVDQSEYERLKDVYVLDEAKMKGAKEDMMVLHPLPRVNEIAYEVDEDSRAFYFKQAKCGMYVRMALMAKLLGEA